MAVRMAISLASRSRCPSRSRSCSTCPMSRLFPFPFLDEIPPQFFFQLLQFVFILDGSGRTQLTDLVVDRYQLLGQAHKRLVPFHFLLHLLQFRPQGQIPCLGLTAYADVPQILGTVPWVALTGTGAVALTAFAIIHGNDAPAKIAEILDLTEQLFPAQLQIAQWLVHSASYLNVGTHSDYRAKKEKTQLPPTKLAHTRCPDRTRPRPPPVRYSVDLLPASLQRTSNRQRTPNHQRVNRTSLR